jgi:serine/threonine-protein kinase
MKNPDDRFQSASEFLSALATVQPENSADFDATMQRTMDIAWPTPRHNPGEPVSRSSDHATQKYDKAVLEDISQQLATYVGPIAKIIVKRASGSSKNLRELCDKVAQEIDSENYRKSFLSSVRKHLHTSGEF